MRSRNECKHWLSVRLRCVVHAHNRVAHESTFGAEKLTALAQREVLSIIDEGHCEKTFRWQRDAPQLTWRMRELATARAARRDLRDNLISEGSEDSKVLRERRRQHSKLRESKSAEPRLFGIRLEQERVAARPQLAF